MKSFKTGSLFMILLAVKLQAQLPETDIFLCSIEMKDGKYSCTKPENITNRPGYDNQPYFTPDGKSILYVAFEDTVQSDVYRYDLAAGVSKQITDTKESEFSPVFTPDRKHLSVVRVDADSGQRLYVLPLDDIHRPVFVQNSKDIGYYCWLDDTTVAMFILGEKFTLQALSLKTHERKLIASDVGRCMKLKNDGSGMYFILKSNPQEWYIYLLNKEDHSLVRIAATLPGSEDFAMLPDGTLLMGNEGKLFVLENGNWNVIADFSAELGDFYRISVSPDGKRLAMVAFQGKKP